MNFSGIIAKLALKMPDSLLIRLSGGKRVSVDGGNLDPQLQFLTYQARKQVDFEQMTPEAMRALQERLQIDSPQQLAERHNVAFSDEVIDRAGHPIPVRIYRPHGQDPNTPLLMFYHAGGGVLGSLETCHALCCLLARIAKCPIASVDYRLAPEHPWPAGLDDAIRAYEWGLANAERLGALPGQAAVGGESIGANFAAIICQEMKREHKPHPVMQLLIYPFVDMLSERPSTSLCSEVFPLTRTSYSWFKSHYLKQDAALDDLRLSPIYETDLENIAPALVITAGFDMLKDEARDYRDRLNDAGVETEYRCFDTLCHGFADFMPLSQASEAACREIATMLRYSIRN